MSYRSLWRLPAGKNTEGRRTKEKPRRANACHDGRAHGSDGGLEVAIRKHEEHGERFQGWYFELHEPDGEFNTTEKSSPWEGKRKPFLLRLCHVNAKY